MPPLGIRFPGRAFSKGSAPMWRTTESNGDREHRKIPAGTPGCEPSSRGQGHAPWLRMRHSPSRHQHPGTCLWNLALPDMPWSFSMSPHAVSKPSFCWGKATCLLSNSTSSTALTMDGGSGPPLDFDSLPSSCPETRSGDGTPTKATVPEDPEFAETLQQYRALDPHGSGHAAPKSGLQADRLPIWRARSFGR